MSTEEPAWKAELMSLLDEHFISSSEEIFDLVLPHIQAAEQRGRNAADEVFTEAMKEILVQAAEALKAAEERGHREALREAAQKIRESAPCHGGTHHYDDGDCWKTWAAADLIDPDKEEA